MTDQATTAKPNESNELNRDPTLLELKTMLEALAEGYGNVGRHFTNAATEIDEAMAELDDLDSE